MGDHQFDLEDYDDDTEDDSSASEDMGIGAILEAVDKKAQSAQQGLDNIRDELDSYLSGLDDTEKVLFNGVADMIREECKQVGQKMESMVEAVDGIRDFVTPDQKKMHDLQTELKQLQNDYAVTLHRVEDEEGAGFTQSKAQIKRAENQDRRKNETTLKNTTTQNKKADNNHSRHFSLMDMYAAFDADDSDDSDSSEEMDGGQLIVKKFNVTMDSASYHCKMIKDVLRGMLGEISGISDAEQGLVTSTLDQVGGSIDRIQFALDNLYDQGLSEHENWKEVRSDLQETKKELERVKAESKSQLETMYTKLQQKNQGGGLQASAPEDDFLATMEGMGLRNLDSEIQQLESENDDLNVAMDTERDRCDQLEREAKNKAAQLRKLHKDHKELREIFEQCQEQLADAKSLIADYDTVDIDEFNAMQDQLEYARKSKVTTICFLDAEIRRLKSEIYSIYEHSLERDRQKSGA